MIYCIKENCPLGGCQHHQANWFEDCDGGEPDIQDLDGMATCAWVTSGEQGGAS